MRRLNAPYGARGILTHPDFTTPQQVILRLNAPYGAWCFLTMVASTWVHDGDKVLMHLMALGAF